MPATASLVELLRQGSSHVVFEGGDRLLFDVSNPKRLILQGVRNPDGPINVELASKLLSAVLYVCDGYERGIMLEKRVTINKKGEPSGELILDSETGKVVGGYGWVRWNQYPIVPVSHQQDTQPSWKLENNLFLVMNSFTPEYAEQAIAEAQVKYDSSRAA